jgi:hypothetical protein
MPPLGGPWLPPLLWVIEETKTRQSLSMCRATSRVPELLMPELP